MIIINNKNSNNINNNNNSNNNMMIIINVAHADVRHSAADNVGPDRRQDLFKTLCMVRSIFKLRISKFGVWVKQFLT